VESTRVKVFLYFLHLLKHDPDLWFPYQMETCEAWMGTVTQCIVCVPADYLPSCSAHFVPCPALLATGRRQLLARLGSSARVFFPMTHLSLPLPSRTLKEKSQLCFTEQLPPLGFLISQAQVPLGKPRKSDIWQY
jgi:hypothetical protein